MDKPVFSSPFRTYRKASGREEEWSFQVMLEESDLWITCLREGNGGLPALMIAEVARLRTQLKDWMARYPEFAPSLVPLDPPRTELPEIIRRMYEGSALFEVGPMACVAGAVSQFIAERFQANSPELIVENGGDIYMFSNHDRKIGLLPDPEQGVLLGLNLPARSFPLSVCSSSATIGHSLSFGRGELATVVAKDACVADAAATAFCNLLKEPEDVDAVLEKAQSFRPGLLLGVFLQCRGNIGLWGDMELTVI